MVYIYIRIYIYIYIYTPGGAVQGGSCPSLGLLWGGGSAMGSLQRTQMCCSAPARAVLFALLPSIYLQLTGHVWELCLEPALSYCNFLSPNIQREHSKLSGAFSAPLVSRATSQDCGINETAVLQGSLDVDPSQNAHSPFVFDVGMFDMQKTFPAFTKSICRYKDDVILL